LTEGGASDSVSSRGAGDGVLLIRLSSDSRTPGVLVGLQKFRRTHKYSSYKTYDVFKDRNDVPSAVLI
jgi:hypothetical protein